MGIGEVLEASRRAYMIGRRLSKAPVKHPQIATPGRSGAIMSENTNLPVVRGFAQAPSCPRSENPTK